MPELTFLGVSLILDPTIYTVSHYVHVCVRALSCTLFRKQMQKCISVSIATVNLYTEQLRLKTQSGLPAVDHSSASLYQNAPDFLR